MRPPHIFTWHTPIICRGHIDEALFRSLDDKFSRTCDLEFPAEIQENGFPVMNQLSRAEKTVQRRIRLAGMISSTEVLLVALRLYIWHLDRPGEWQDVEELIKACSRLNSGWRAHLTAARRVLGIFKRLYPTLQLRLAKDYQWRLKVHAGIDLDDSGVGAEFMRLPHDLTINADVEAFAAATPFLLGLTRNYLLRSKPRFSPASHETTNHFDPQDDNVVFGRNGCGNAYTPERQPAATTGQPATGNWADAAEEVKRAKEEALARLENERSAW